MTSIESVLKVYGNGIEADDFADQLGHLMRRRDQREIDEAAPAHAVPESHGANPWREPQ